VNKGAGKDSKTASIARWILHRSTKDVESVKNQGFLVSWHLKPGGGICKWMGKKSIEVKAVAKETSITP